MSLYCRLPEASHHFVIPCSSGKLKNFGFVKLHHRSCMGQTREGGNMYLFRSKIILANIMPKSPCSF